MKRSKALCLLALQSLVVTGCQAMQDVGQAPRLTPMTTVALPLPAPPEAERAHSIALQSNSTWSDRSSDFFRDSRAMRRGDILTVKISIRDKASLDSSANRSRDSKLESQAKLNFALKAFGLAKSGDGSLDGGTGSKTSTEGRGAVSRSESIDLLVAATIVEILSSGNLVIRGNQEVSVNFEKRVLSVEGVVRPRDIATDNSVSYEKIAEARVSYGGEGRTMEILQPPVGQQIIDRITPF
jgi:flagellar L-ring protein FlgH